MRVPIFEALAVDTSLQTLLGGAEFRCYQFGEAPQACKTPFVVWQLVNGEPINALNELPTMDFLEIQVDVYGPEHEPAVARECAAFVRDALEPHGHIVHWIGESRDPDTREYRVAFEMDWFLDRL